MRELDSWEHDEVVTRLGTRSGVPITVAVHSRRSARRSAARDSALPALARRPGRRAAAVVGDEHKCAAAGLPFGGGKSVLAVPADTPVTPALPRGSAGRPGELIETFDGTYLTGPDVGTGPADMLALRRWTPHAFCLPEEHGGTGSSSGPTAAGVLAALRGGEVGVRHGVDDRRRAVVIGMARWVSLLAGALSAEGAEVVVSDVDAYAAPAIAGRTRKWRFSWRRTS